MSDAHTRNGRDMPDCPKARVFAGKRFWYWQHMCPWHGHSVASGGYLTQPAAFAAAATHMRHCEVA